MLILLLFLAFIIGLVIWLIKLLNTPIRIENPEDPAKLWRIHIVKKKK